MGLLRLIKGYINHYSPIYNWYLGPELYCFFQRLWSPWSLPRYFFCSTDVCQPGSGPRAYVKRILKMCPKLETQCPPWPDSFCQWIGWNIYRKPKFFPWNIGFSGNIFLKPIQRFWDAILRVTGCFLVCNGDFCGTIYPHWGWSSPDSWGFIVL